MPALAFLFLAAAAWLLMSQPAQASMGSVTTAEGEGDPSPLDVLASVQDAIVTVQDAVMSLGASMRTSDAGIAAIADREGFSPLPYRDARGWSVGYGHFIKPGEDYSDGVSEDLARQLLADDVSTAENAVNAHVTVSLTQGQYDALVSFAYNVGATAFARSTLVRLLNAGDYAGAERQFARWVYSVQGGVRQVTPALVARRESEAAQFLT